ncbi:MAG: ABC transporter substrate-binding protein [Gammaproteobacteria bacterium]|nr:ABC transporter substrate-binding protein [Gammaproteobacteria bacterium]
MTSAARVLGMALTAFAVACGDSAMDQAPGAARHQLADEAPLRMAVTLMPASFGDPFRTLGVPGDWVWRQIFDPLTESDDEGRIVPLLAESFENLDPHTWRFVLRDGVRYANGRPFNAFSAKEVFDWLISDEGQATVVGWEMRRVSEVEAADARTLIFTTWEPDPVLPNRLTSAMMVEPQAWRELGRQGFSRAPVGTGSYQLTDWQNRNGAMVLAANPYAWRPPAISRVEIYPLRDHASRLQATLSGQLDITMSLRPEQLDAFRARGFTVHADILRQILAFAFDVSGHPDSPVADVRVRQALNYAIDRKAISEDILQGFAPPASQGSAPNVFGHNPRIKPYPYDPDKARALLAEAGYPQGFSTEVQVVTGTYPNDLEIFARLQQDLAAVGVEMAFRRVLFSDWIRQFFQGVWRTEMFTLAWNTAPHNDALRPMEQYSCLKARPFFCDETLSEKLVAAGREMDTRQREVLLQELALDYRRLAASLLLLEYGHMWVVGPRLSGFRVRTRAPQLYRVERTG